MPTKMYRASVISAPESEREKHRLSKGEVRKFRKADNKSRQEMKNWREHNS